MIGSRVPRTNVRSIVDVRIGARFRALRFRLGWRQIDLAQRARVSKSLVSLLERGQLERVSIARLRAIARALDAEFVLGLRWRGGDLDRLLDEGHAMLVGHVAELLRAAGWTVQLEVSYAIYGERGSIDIVAWHPTSRILLVVEVKTDLVVIEETLRKHDEKVRLAPRIVAERGWRPASVARLLILPEHSTPRRRVERHRAVLTAAYPSRGLEVRRWLAAPSGQMAGLLFVDVGRGRRAGRSNADSTISRKRVRPRRTRSAA
jgi:transcriptional regulator with XRE-family HTH domain